MNRSILIVICDFLLVSLLVFSSVDINKVAENGTAQNSLRINLATNALDSGKDLAAVMKLALDDERRNREQLLGELNRTRATAGEREHDVQASQQQTRRLQEQYDVAQTNLLALNRQLESSSAEALIAREKLAAMEAEARKQKEQNTALQQQLAHLVLSNELANVEKRELTGRLQVAEVETRHATEQAARMTEEVKVEREEKAKLAAGVQALASKSGELSQEIRENRPLAANMIFSEFVSNRVQATFNASRSLKAASDSTKSKETVTVLVSDGTNTFALCHVQDTPLTFWNPGTDWAVLTGVLSRGLDQVTVRSLSFGWPDPRVVLVPIAEADARKLGCKVYRTSTDPFKFQDAVLVGAQEGYYGECKFEVDLSTPDYVKLDRNFLKGLFGKFNPSRGDLVFSKTGELLGIMANGTYCTMVRSFDASATFSFGQDVRTQHTGETLSTLYSQVAQLPSKLQ